MLDYILEKLPPGVLQVFKYTGEFKLIYVMSLLRYPWLLDDISIAIQRTGTRNKFLLMVVDADLIMAYVFKVTGIQKYLKLMKIRTNLIA